MLLYWLGAFATRQGRDGQAAAAYQEAVELFAAAEIAAGRDMTVVQGLDYAAGWADQRGRGPT